MMYNVARALALIGLVGVSASNTTTTNTTSSGSTAPPQSVGCQQWTQVDALTQLSRRQLSTNTTTGSCPSSKDAFRCLYVQVEFSGLQSHVNMTNGCPSTYVATDAAYFKAVFSAALCGTDNDCATKAKDGLSLRLKCKAQSDTAGTPTLVNNPTRRLTTKNVHLHLTGGLELSKVIVAGGISASKLGEKLWALKTATATKTGFKDAIQAGLRAAPKPTATAGSVVGDPTSVTIADFNARVGVTDPTDANCVNLALLSELKTKCDSATTYTACNHYKAPAGGDGTSGAFSLVASSIVFAMAALI